MASFATRGDESRTNVIAIRLTKAERLLVEHRAAVAGLTVSSWAERVLTEKRGPGEAAQTSSLQPDMVAELKRIANNLIQIAATTNAGQDVPAQEYLWQVHDLLDALIRDDLLGTHVVAARSREGLRHDLLHP